MIRNIEKTIEQYNKLSGNGTTCQFHPLELKAIIDKANGDIYEAVFFAIEFAYMVGYRKGRKDQRERQRNSR